MLNVSNRGRSLVLGIFGALLVPMCMALLPARVSAAEDSIEIRNNLPLLLQTLGSMPFSSEGSGPAVYVVEFSTCPYARRFESDYGAKLAGMGFQVRRLFYGVDEATQNNAAAAALSRDPAMQRAFMFEGRQAPSLYDSPAALEAYQDVPDKLKVIVGVLQENGWSTDRVVSPMLIYPHGKQLFADGGYRIDHFKNKILPRLQLASSVGASPAADAKVVAEATNGRLQALGGTYFDKDFEASVEYAAEVIDLNGDGQPEVFTRHYGSMFGMAGVNMDLLIKGTSGQWVSQFGFPGAYRILEAKSGGYPDIEIEGPGTCFPVWRWNGSAYAIHKSCDR